MESGSFNMLSEIACGPNKLCLSNGKTDLLASDDLFNFVNTICNNKQFPLQYNVSSMEANYFLKEKSHESLNFNKQPAGNLESTKSMGGPSPYKNGMNIKTVKYPRFGTLKKKDSDSFVKNPDDEQNIFSPNCNSLHTYSVVETDFMGGSVFCSNSQNVGLNAGVLEFVSPIKSITSSSSEGLFNNPVPEEKENYCMNTTTVCADSMDAIVCANSMDTVVCANCTDTREHYVISDCANSNCSPRNGSSQTHIATNIATNIETIVLPILEPRIISQNFISEFSATNPKNVCSGNSVAPEFSSSQYGFSVCSKENNSFEDMSTNNPFKSDDENLLFRNTSNDTSKGLDNFHKEPDSTTTTCCRIMPSHEINNYSKCNSQKNSHENANDDNSSTPTNDDYNNIKNIHENIKNGNEKDEHYCKNYDDNSMPTNDDHMISNAQLGTRMHDEVSTNIGFVSEIPVTCVINHNLSSAVMSQQPGTCVDSKKIDSNVKCVVSEHSKKDFFANDERRLSSSSTKTNESTKSNESQQSSKSNGSNSFLNLFHPVLSFLTQSGDNTTLKNLQKIENNNYLPSDKDVQPTQSVSLSNTIVKSELKTSQKDFKGNRKNSFLEQSLINLLAFGSSSEDESVEKNCRARPRQVNLSGDDCMWPPHLHPHNQEWRVRYRYKGSMRVKTISCRAYGVERAKEIALKFVERWVSLDRRIASKTKRSKLCVLDFHDTMSSNDNTIQTASSTDLLELADAPRVSESSFFPPQSCARKRKKNKKELINESQKNDSHVCDFSRKSSGQQVPDTSQFKINHDSSSQTNRNLSNTTNSLQTICLSVPASRYGSTVLLGDCLKKRDVNGSRNIFLTMVEESNQLKDKRYIRNGMTEVLKGPDVMKVPYTDKEINEDPNTRKNYSIFPEDFPSKRKVSFNDTYLEGKQNNNASKINNDNTENKKVVPKASLLSQLLKEAAQRRKVFEKCKSPDDDSYCNIQPTDCTVGEKKDLIYQQNNNVQNNRYYQKHSIMERFFDFLNKWKDSQMCVEKDDKTVVSKVLVDPKKHVFQNKRICSNNSGENNMVSEHINSENLLKKVCPKTNNLMLNQDFSHFGGDSLLEQDNDKNNNTHQNCTENKSLNNGSLRNPSEMNSSKIVPTKVVYDSLLSHWNLNQIKILNNQIDIFLIEMNKKSNDVDFGLKKDERNPVFKFLLSDSDKEHKTFPLCDENIPMCANAITNVMIKNNESDMIKIVDPNNGMIKKNNQKRQAIDCLDETLLEINKNQVLVGEKNKADIYTDFCKTEVDKSKQEETKRYGSNIKNNAIYCSRQLSSHFVRREENHVLQSRLSGDVVQPYEDTSSRNNSVLASLILKKLATPATTFGTLLDLLDRNRSNNHHEMSSNCVSVNSNIISEHNRHKTVVNQQQISRIVSLSGGSKKGSGYSYSKSLFVPSRVRENPAESI